MKKTSKSLVVLIVLLFFISPLTAQSKSRLCGEGAQKSVEGAWSSVKEQIDALFDLGWEILSENYLNHKPIQEIMRQIDILQALRWDLFNLSRCAGSCSCDPGAESYLDFYNDMASQLEGELKIELEEFDSGTLIALEEIPKTEDFITEPTFLDQVTDETLSNLTNVDLSDLTDRKSTLVSSIENIVPDDGSEGSEDFAFSTYTANGYSAVWLPGADDWTELKEGMNLPLGTRIYTGMDSTTLLSIPELGFIEVGGFTDVTLTKSGIQQGVQEGAITNDVYLKVGEVELDIEGGLFDAALQVQLTNYVAGVRGTHFWVSKDDINNLAILGVYEGEVELTNKKSGEKTIVKPKEDGTPGIVLFSDFSEKGSSNIIFVIIGIIVVLVILAVALFVLKLRKK